MEEEEKMEPKRPELPEGWMWADKLAEATLSNAADPGLAYELAEYHLAFSPEYEISDSILEVADSNVDIYNSERRKWLMEDESHIEAMEEAIKEGLVGTNEFDLNDAIGVAQYSVNEQALHDDIADIKHAAMYLYVARNIEGNEHHRTDVALPPEIIEAIDELDYEDSGIDRLSELTGELDEQLEEIEARPMSMEEAEAKAQESPCRLKDEAANSREASTALSANEKAHQAPSASKEVR